MSEASRVWREVTFRSGRIAQIPQEFATRKLVRSVH